jgi:hypothetical protein
VILSSLNAQTAGMKCPMNKEVSIMWHKFDNFMQDWYMSMSYPLRDFVMWAIGLVIGITLFFIGGIYV